MWRIYMALMSLKPTRRSLAIAAAASLFAGGAAGALNRHEGAMPTDPPKRTLLTAPIELAGNWGKMIPHSADEVVELMRSACLDGVRLVSDRQPARLRVDEHASGTPAIWLHSDPATTAWIIVDIGQQAWCQLAYQFGHELGHVVANSWQANATPGPPSQWLEEGVVEAFSLRGLGNLGRRWKETPPFPNDNAYGDAVLQYREDIVRQYRQLAADQGAAKDFAGWFHGRQGDIEKSGVLPYGRVAAAIILEAYERTPNCVEAIGAMNRWPARTHLPVMDYLAAWEASCFELKASPALPTYLRARLHRG
jgi:hypothetical protein